MYTGGKGLGSRAACPGNVPEHKAFRLSDDVLPFVEVSPEEEIGGAFPPRLPRKAVGTDFLFSPAIEADLLWCIRRLGG
jgi:hypothetical protein